MTKEQLLHLINVKKAKENKHRKQNEKPNPKLDGTGAVTNSAQIFQVLHTGSRHCTWFTVWNIRYCNGFLKVQRETKGLSGEKVWQCKKCDVYSNRHGGYNEIFWIGQHYGI